MKTPTAYDRKLARRVIALAVARAERNRQPFTHGIELWKIMVEMSHRPKRARTLRKVAP